MGSKQEATVADQKAHYEAKLNERRSYLVEKGIDPQEIAKDAILKKLKAKVKKMNLRLEALANIKQRTEELDQIKANRLAAPKKEKAPKVGDSHYITRDGKTQDTISMRRYFCSQCHVPQVKSEPLVENTHEGN